MNQENLRENIAKTWDDPARIERLGVSRQIYRPATRQAVKGILEKYETAGKRKLEIGSGLGELVLLVPEYEAEIQQTEYGRNIIVEHKKRNPRSNIIRANVYGLPFADESYDIVVGYSSFDTLIDLERAIEEIDRVLVPGGMFIHFLDLVPDAYATARRARDAGLTLLPYIHETKGIGFGARILDTETFERMLDSYDDDAITRTLRVYQREQEKYLASRDERVIQLMRQITEYTGTREGVVKSWLEIFEEQMKAAVDAEQYNIHQAEIAVGQIIVPRNGFSENGVHANVIRTSFLREPVGIDLEVRRVYGREMVRLESEVHVIVAEKIY